MTDLDAARVRQELFGVRDRVEPWLPRYGPDVPAASRLVAASDIPHEIALEAGQLGRRLGHTPILAADPLRVVRLYLGSVGGTKHQRRELAVLIWSEFVGVRSPSRDRAFVERIVQRMADDPSSVLEGPLTGLAEAAADLDVALEVRMARGEDPREVRTALYREATRAHEGLLNAAREGGYEWFVPQQSGAVKRQFLEWVGARASAAQERVRLREQEMAAKAAAAKRERRRVEQELAAAVARWQARRDEEAVREDLRRAEAERQERIGRREPVCGPPTPQPFGVSHEGAEHLVCQWMKHLGEGSATVTRVAKDGGVDGDGERFIAQVKNYTGSVGAPEVQAMAGIAAGDGRRPLFFTSGTYTVDAMRFAEQVGMPLLCYDAMRGTLMGANARGAAVVDDGLWDDRSEDSGHGQQR